MATPLLTALREAYPQAHLTWIVEYTAFQAIDANPDVDELIIWNGGFWNDLLHDDWKQMRNKRYLLGLRWLSSASRFLYQLRRRKFDIYISFQPEEWPSLIRASGAACTIGVFDTFRQFYGDAATSRYKRFYKNTFAFDDLPEHRTDQYLLPLRALGVANPKEKRMEIGYTQDDADTADHFLAQNGIGPHEHFVVIAPMTTWASRNWAGERYAHLGDKLMQRGLRVVLIGSAQAKEQEAVRAISAQMAVPPAMALGTLSFRQMAALLDRAALLISGDTGPMHVAAAVKTPYLALFGPTPVAGRAPLEGLGLSLFHPVPCGPCDQELCSNSGDDYLRCMRLITVEEVLEAADKLLEVKGAIA